MTASPPTAARFWDRIADSYAARPVADEAAYQEKLRVTRQYFRPDMRVLEVGCGTGSTAIAHAPFVAGIRAIDVSSRMIEIARDKARAAGVENVTFELGGAEQLEAGERYHAVLALSLLHLLDDKQRFITTVFDMLEPGGVFATSTPCLSGARYLPLRVLIPLGRLFGRLPQVRFFSLEQLRTSLTDAGFVIDHQWQPGPGKAVFIVARKPEG